MGGSQIFKSPVPTEMLAEILNKICSVQENALVLNYSAFKKGVFMKIIPVFIDECIPYYHASKLHYLTKKLTYNSFITIVRQICKHRDIQYVSKIKYDKTKYEIMYSIYINTI
jgi:hypothetical protein